MIIDLIYLFIIMAAGLAILLGIHLLTKTKNKLPNKLLGSLMLFFALNILDAVSILSGYYLKYPHITAFTAVFPYVFGPLMYLFAKSVSEKTEKLNFKDYLHLVPFVVLNIIGFPLYFMKSADFKIGMASHTVNAPVLEFISMFIPVVGIIYVILSAKVFVAYRKKIKQNFSNIDQINMEWLWYFIVGNGVVWMFVILAYVTKPLLPDWFIPNLLIYIPVSLFIWWIGYISLAKQSSYLVNSADVVKLVAPAYSKSGLTDKQAETVVENLKRIMAEEKPFIESTLKLSDLSDKLDTPPHYLTEILNTRLKQNFYDYVNGFRVEEVKRLIRNDKNKKYNLLSLALEAGFSSKSSFNSIFKKHTGITPSQYRSEISNKNAA